MAKSAVLHDDVDSLQIARLLFKFFKLRQFANLTQGSLRG